MTRMEIKNAERHGQALAAGNDIHKIGIFRGVILLAVAFIMKAAPENFRERLHPFAGGKALAREAGLGGGGNVAHMALAGGKIGIAGGPLDKSWLILRAYAKQQHGFDLMAGTEQVYGAPPLIFKSGLKGEIGGAINFWHFMAKMKAAGMTQIISVAEAAEALGLDPRTPLLGYVMKDAFVAESPDVAHGFYAASRAAKAALAEDDALWEELRPVMNAKSDAQFETLRKDWRAGIPAAGAVDLDAANAFLAVMAALGGEKLVGQAATLPAGTFMDVSQGS